MQQPLGYLLLVRQTIQENLNAKKFFKAIKTNISS